MTYLLVLAALLNAPGAFVDGVAAKDRLWLRDDQSVVTVFDRVSGRSSIAAEHVISMDRAKDGGVIALIEVTSDPTTKKNVYEFRDIAPQAAIASRFPLDDDRALAIIAGNGPPTIVTAKTIMSLDKGSWQAARLTAELRTSGVAKGVQTSEGVLLGFEDGGLYAINRMTGVTRQVKLGDAPLTGLTGLAVDRVKPECALVSVALKQDARGYLARVCGPQAESIYSKLNKDGTTSPILGVVAADKGWVGIGGGKLLRSTDGKVKESAQPKPKAWKGLTLNQQTAELVLVQVTGRETPLVVPVQR